MWLTGEHADKHVLALIITFEEMLIQYFFPTFLVDLILKEGEEVVVMPTSLEELVLHMKGHGDADLLLFTIIFSPRMSKILQFFDEIRMHLECASLVVLVVIVPLLDCLGRCACAVQ